MPPRRVVTVTKRSRHEPPDAGLAGPTTPEQRLALVDVLTREAWALAGRPWPQLPRSEWPVRVLRRRSVHGANTGR
jgi:hypothetical protein